MYQHCLNSSTKHLSESSETYTHFSERHLQAMWLEQVDIIGLKTYKGESVTIISPGIWNAEAGPDFLKAHLIINGMVVKGDVELHLFDEGWVQHRHQEDPRYNQVVFHLSLYSSNNRIDIVTENKKYPHSAVLEPYLQNTLSEISKRIDLDLYPHRRCVGAGKCSEKIFLKIPQEERFRFFREAAYWRLEKKWEHLVLEKSPIDIGIAMALGYTKNAQAFRSLCLYITEHLHLPEQSLLAHAMSICSFFSEKYQKIWGKSPYYQELKSLSIVAPFSIQLNTAYIRPYNHPIRRLFLLIYLLKNGINSVLFKALGNLCFESFKEGFTDKDASKLRNAIFNTFPNIQDSYWLSHYTFEEKVQKSPLSLLGDSLKLVIVVNVLFPWLYRSLSLRDQGFERLAFEKLYLACSSVKNNKVRYLVNRFFESSDQGSSNSCAMLEQGMLQLHKDYCLHYEASCDGCPFVNNYLEMRNSQLITSYTL